MPANQFVEKMLKEWKLEQLIVVFEENEIDEEAFRSLNTDIVKTLIPKIGPQVKFLKNWSRTFQDSPVFEPINTVQAMPDEVMIIVDELAASAADYIPNTALTLDNINVLNEASVQVPAPKVPVSVRATSQPEELRSAASSTSSPISSVSRCSALTRYSLNSSEDLEQLLKSTVEGLVVINTYTYKKEFDNQLRLHLANTVISHEIANSQEFKICSSRLLELAQLIEKTFPTEKSETYYVPFATNSVTNKRVLAKGKLYDKYCANRAFLRQSGAISSKRKRTDNKNHFVLGFRENLRSIEDSEGCSEKLQWLKNCLEPWPTVEAYWGDTSKTRLENLLASESITSSQYLTTFKVLRQPTGYNLFHIDFARMYPEKSIILYAEWSIFEKQIIKYVKTKTKNDAAIKALLSVFPDAEDSIATGSLSDSSAKARTAIVLRILPLLLPCPQIKTKNKSLWRVSKAELQNFFFLHVTTVTELESELSIRRRKLASHGLTEQPIPVVVGSSLTNIETCYVCINDTKYLVDSPLAALDTTFKSFYALQVQYPREAESPWLIIQQHLYKISAEGDRTLPAILTLIADLVRQTCES